MQATDPKPQAMMNSDGRLSRSARRIFWPALLVMTALFLLPEEYVSSPIFGWWDKAQHALAFGATTLLGLLAYGAMIEVIQSATGWRWGDPLDAAADAVGVLAVALLIRAAGLAR